jgi:hypothetical protein
MSISSKTCSTHVQSHSISLHMCRTCFNCNSSICTSSTHVQTMHHLATVQWTCMSYVCMLQVSRGCYFQCVINNVHVYCTCCINWLLFAACRFLGCGLQHDRSRGLSTQSHRGPIWGSHIRLITPSHRGPRQGSHARLITPSYRGPRQGSHARLITPSHRGMIKQLLSSQLIAAVSDYRDMYKW